ncbi:hypothetical protein HAX54_003013 [Datura stramonium]|uniref:Uncharacterized protein n=1 Tax=Datura stramonium TaxID=4076 RepID=A0ABS8WVU6_DATST|nr:hypothetical protein [Datura stramonium]
MGQPNDDSPLESSSKYSDSDKANGGGDNPQSTNSKTSTKRLREEGKAQKDWHVSNGVPKPNLRESIALLGPEFFAAYGAHLEVSRKRPKSQQEAIDDSQQGLGLGCW